MQSIFASGGFLAVKSFHFDADFDMHRAYICACICEVSLYKMCAGVVYHESERLSNSSQVVDAWQMSLKLKGNERICWRVKSNSAVTNR